jgi:hypothetical protein
VGQTHILENIARVADACLEGTQNDPLMIASSDEEGGAIPKSASQGKRQNNRLVVSEGEDLAEPDWRCLVTLDSVEEGGEDERSGSGSRSALTGESSAGAGML